MQLSDVFNELVLLLFVYLGDYITIFRYESIGIKVHFLDPNIQCNVLLYFSLLLYQFKPLHSFNLALLIINYSCESAFLRIYGDFFTFVGVSFSHHSLSIHPISYHLVLNNLSSLFSFSDEFRLNLNLVNYDRRRKILLSCFLCCLHLSPVIQRSPFSSEEMSSSVFVELLLIFNGRGAWLMPG